MRKIPLFRVVSGLLTFCILMTSGCDNGKTHDQDIDDLSVDEPDEIVLEDDVLSEPIKDDSIKTIFYDLATPVELTDFVRFSKTAFDPDLLNPVENKNRYTINMKQALNLGVYGTDMVYCRLFSQKQESINYLSAIRTVSQEIGIPEDQISETLGKADKYMENKDSLFSVIQEAYLRSNEYLKESERNSTAALVYFGAWTEALHIAINLYKKEDAAREKIAMHIAEQKFALNNLLVLLRNTYDNPDVHQYIVLVKKLKKVYDGIDIFSENEQPEINTVKKVIIIDESKTKITSAQIEEITKLIRRMRQDIIS
ncbi:MAG: hypothetical protein KJ607_01515 [Bacteroidetes bacterium]|nr:hypothetical protein [Bacteroidota bacterium]